MQKKAGRSRLAPVVPFCGRCDKGIVLVNVDGSRWDPKVGGPCRVILCNCRREPRRRIESEGTATIAEFRLRAAWQAD